VRLRASRGSVVILAIETEHGPIKWGLLNEKERAALKKSLLKVNAGRAKKGRPLTTERP
jgi:hypothetical protein